MDNISFLIYSFVSIFVIVNPISAVVSYISLTSNMKFDEKRSIGKKSVILACIIALFFAITGKTLLDIFGINVDLLRIAGGVLLFHVALDMMLAKVSRESITQNEINQSIDRSDIWIFPIALPLLTGPGTITTVIVIMGSTELILQKIIVIISILASFLIAYIIFNFSRKIYRYIGYTGMLVFTRIMGLFLASIAVDFIVKGVWNIYSMLTLS